MQPRHVNVRRSPRAAQRSKREPDPELERARELYRYRTPAQNQLHPIAVCESLPRNEEYDYSWKVPMLPRYAAASANRFLNTLLFGLEKASFRFDKLRAYREIFPILPGSAPDFAEIPDGDTDTLDALFGYCRVAGANPLSLERKTNLAMLRQRIRFDPKRIEECMRKRWSRTVSLAHEAANGRLFAVDLVLIKDALENDRTRDSRWREKYLPAPIGVFLEAPGLLEGSSLVPLAIQIDQVQVDEDKPNPVYYPDDGWGWRIAKLYFEAADVSFNSGCGHVLRSHLVMEPFCMATARQLSRRHPVRVLLEPHTHFTLAANEGAYDSFIDRRMTYHDFYGGTLAATRQIAIQNFLAVDFAKMELEADLERREVDERPADYPYRDDARLWVGPIRDFVTEYVDAFYAGNNSVASDEQLQEWFDELVDEARGALRNPVHGGVLDTKKKLIDLLAQVLFIAGPGHASQHYSSTYYYRYAPVFPGAAYNPPPWRQELVDKARFLNTLPPIRTANRQFMYNSFLEYRYGAFGDYDGYRLSELPEAAGPIARLQSKLGAIEEEIARRGEQRRFPYEFLLPSRVPNSINL